MATALERERDAEREKQRERSRERERARSLPWDIPTMKQINQLSK